MTKSNITRPTYYEADSIEAIDVIEAFDLNFHLGNAIKYILRAGKKGDHPDDGINDLLKAHWYLTREIANETDKRQSDQMSTE